MGRPPSQSRDKFIIRLPEGMRERIKAAADANGRTMTAEIVWRLERSLGGMEARLDGQDQDTDVTADLAYETHEHAWELTWQVMMLKGFAGRVAAHLGIEGPMENDAASAKPKRKEG